MTKVYNCGSSLLKAVENLCCSMHGFCNNGYLCLKGLLAPRGCAELQGEIVDTL